MENFEKYFNEDFDLQEAIEINERKKKKEGESIWKEKRI